MVRTSLTLRVDRDHWPCQKTSVPQDAPLEEKIISFQCASSSPAWDLASRYSSWPKLIRVTAYVKKFISSCRHISSPCNTRSRCHARSAPTGIAVSASECNDARTFWIKQIQAELFPAEIHALSQNHSVSVKSSLLCLNPFLDKDGIVRVGGRLNNAPFPFCV